MKLESVHATSVTASFTLAAFVGYCKFAYLTPSFVNGFDQVTASVAVLSFLEFGQSHLFFRLVYSRLLYR